MVDYVRSRAVADRQIRKWGAEVILRRDSGDRTCWALEVQLNASEKRQLKNLNSRVFIISAIGLAVPPAKDDALVLPDGAVLRQTAPVSPLQPQPGGIIIYYEIQVEG